MLKAIGISVLASATTITVGSIAADAMTATEVCVAKSPEGVSPDIGYELIDLVRMQAWVTTDWDLASYEDFRPGLFAPHLFKNEPRLGTAGAASVLKSPGCANEGEFTYKTRFGRTFFHIADVNGRVDLEQGGGAMTAAIVNKHHVLAFEAGQSVEFLAAPDGGHFLNVNRSISGEGSGGEIPATWTVETVTLSAPWRAELMPSVYVLRVSDGRSFQGPITDMPQIAQ